MMVATDDVTRLRDFIDTVPQHGDRRLPPEPKLCEVLGLSRGRLRTLLKQLEGEGLIWRHVGKGTFVGPREIAVGHDGWLSSISGDNIMEARLALEPQLAAHAALHATPLEVAGMDQCLEEMARTGSFLAWKRLDERLHRAIAEATHNALLLTIYDTLAQAKLALDARVLEVFGSLSEPRRTTDDDHRALVDAIRSHNPRTAEAAMRDHIKSVRTSMFGVR